MVKTIPLVALLLSLALPAPGTAAVGIYDEERKLDTIRSGKCRVSGSRGNRDFFATARSVNRGYRLTVFIDAPVFRGFGREYTMYYGGGDPQAFLTRRADEETFSNFKLPGTPAGVLGAGAVEFNGTGRRIGLGMYAANNKRMTEGLAFAGGFRCRYTRG